MISSGINGNPNYPINTKTLVLNQHYKILLTQKHLGRELYKYSIFIDDENIFSINNTDARKYTNVKIYVSDPWFLYCNCAIKNLQLLSLP